MEVLAIVLWVVAGVGGFMNIVTFDEPEAWSFLGIPSATLALTGWGLYAGGMWAMIAATPWILAVATLAFVVLFEWRRNYVPFTRRYVSKKMRSGNFSPVSLNILKNAKALPADFYPADLEQVLLALDEKYSNRGLNELRYSPDEYNSISGEVGKLLNAHAQQREALRLAGISPVVDTLPDLLESMRKDRQLVDEVTKELTR